jgi:hypothetical protein
MVAVVMLQFVSGIALTQGLSDPREVTLRWLRLGGLVALGLLSVGLAGAWVSGGSDDLSPLVALGLAGAACAAQLMATQLGRRGTQRAAAWVAWLVAGAGATLLLGSLARPAEAGEPAPGLIALGATVLTSSGLLGGFLMTMLLGHAYLTAGGEMTQRPFLRLVVALGALLALRACLSVASGAWPYFAAEESSVGAMWNLVMMSARYAAGLVVPGVFTAMTLDCVRRRSNQSATGILYVAGVLVILGEGAALALLRGTGLAF